MDKKWWKEEVIYQIYPRSFKDSNGDGIGDLPGIITKLDYLKLLGVDIIWLCPVYMSPNDDNGYDISQYYEIHPEFGTMEDFDELLSGLKARGMKLIMDLVVNHSSDEHPWFVQSKSSIDNKYRDYYYWHKGDNGAEPNNWLSFFGGSAWELDENTGEYYLHLFTKKQPDLNWENPNLRNEIYDIIRFWLDKGIHGFRMDVISLISKRLDFKDASFSSFGELVEKYYANGPRVHEYIHEMYESVIKNYDVMTVGEGPGINKDVGKHYVGKSRKELNMIFHLDHMFLGFGPRGRFDPIPYDWNDIKRIFRDWYKSIGDEGWVSIFLDNHDFPRLVSRFGNDEKYRQESAKLLAMLILTMRGTACIYQGSELGMTNVRMKTIDEFRDVETLNFYKEFRADGMEESEFIARANKYGRDNVRTPMQWDESRHSGFTDGEPWIGVNENYGEINAERVLSDENSIFYFYKNLLALRKSHKVLVYGEWEEIESGSQNLYVYKRMDNTSEYLVILNHSDSKETYDSSHYNSEKLLLSNYKENSKEKLMPWEARLYKIK